MVSIVIMAVLMAMVMGTMTSLVIMPSIAWCIVMNIDLSGVCSIFSILVALLKAISGNPLFDGSMIGFNHSMIVLSPMGDGFAPVFAMGLPVLLLFVQMPGTVFDCGSVCGNSL
jgi:hypothetical protein